MEIKFKGPWSAVEAVRIAAGIALQESTNALRKRLGAFKHTKSTQHQTEHSPTHSRHIPGSVKREVFMRDDGQCVQCGRTENLQYDHILPYSKGGTSKTAENIQILCFDCNQGKKAKFV